MRDYADWLDSDGFYVRDAWDDVKGQMGEPGKIKLFPRQRRILEEALRTDADGNFLYQTVLYSDIKKCVAPETRILTAELDWVDAGTLEIGDKLLAFDDDKQKSGRGGTHRYYRVAVVTGTGRDVMPSYRITLSGGTVVTVSANHKFFTKVVGGKNLTWKPASKLKIGDPLTRFLRVWDKPSTVDDGYMAGVFDGEGHIKSDSSAIEFGQKENPLLERGKRILDEHGISYKEYINAQEWSGGICEVHQIKMYSRATALFCLGHFKPSRLLSKINLDGCGMLWSLEHETIVNVEYLETEMVTLSTSTGTFFADGFASHNTGKTVIASSVGAWYAECARPGTEIYILANSQEQGAGRVMRDIIFHFQKRQEAHGKKYCKIGEFRVDFPNGTFIQVLSNSFRSAAGSRHALTLYDELWGSVTEIDRRLWDEMVPIPTVPNSLRFISSYAGFENESELLWEQYIRGVGTDEHPKGQGQKIEGLEDLPVWKNGRMFTYWSHESDLPWYTEEYLDEQQRTERPAAFLRLFLNQWVTSHEEFIPVEWWDFASKSYEAPATLWDDHPFRWWPVTIGVDAGIRRDSTALVVVGYDGHRGKLGIVHHRIWKPTPEDPVDLEATVEQELRFLYTKFNVSSIVYDPTHLLTIMTKLEREGFPTRLFDQTIPNMISASQLLYDILKARNLEAYPADDLRKHIQMAVAETSARGFRIVKTKVSRRHHIDGAVALAMAAYEAVKNGGVDTSIPVIIKSPFADMSSLKIANKAIPFPLQTDDEED